MKSHLALASRETFAIVEVLEGEALKALERAARTSPNRSGGARNSKKGSSLLCLGVEVRCQFIEAEKANHKINTLCRVMRVPRSTFYAWRKQTPSKRQVEDAKLKPLIREIHLESRESYGAPRVHRKLRHAGISIGRHRVARLMREERLQAKQRRKFKATTDSNHGHATAPNLLAREFRPLAVDTVWVGDITYIWTREGWLYLAVLLDLYSRRVVGWAMDGTAHHQTARPRRIEDGGFPAPPPSGPDSPYRQGLAVRVKAYQDALKAIGASCSMSRKGNCWDNAPSESFFATFKKDAVHGVTFATRDEARREIVSYLCWYNAHRLHSAIGYLRPEDV